MNVKDIFELRILLAVKGITLGEELLILFDDIMKENKMTQEVYDCFSNICLIEHNEEEILKNGRILALKLNLMWY
jgi:hypothetical protein